MVPAAASIPACDSGARFVDDPPQPPQEAALSVPEWTKPPPACIGDGWCDMSGGTSDIRAIFAERATNVWMARGPGRLVHFDGLAWTEVECGGDDALGGLSAIAATRSDDVWVASSVAVFHWTGAKCERSLDLKHLGSVSIAAPAPDAVFVSDLGGVQMFDGRAWTTTIAFDGIGVDTTHVVTGSNPRNVWRFGNGVVVRWDGERWCAMRATPPSPGLVLRGGTARRSDATYAFWPGPGLESFERGAWKPFPWLPIGVRAKSLTSGGPGDLWVAGEETTASRTERVLLHHEAGRWARQPIAGVSAVSASSPNDVWATNGSGVDHWDGQKWTSVRASALPHIYTVGGTGPNDVWAAYSQGMAHYDGVRFSFFSSPDVHRIWSASPELAFGAGWQGIARWNGSVWSLDFPMNGVKAIHGRSATDVYAVVGTELRRFDGTKWSPFPAPFGAGLALWVASNGDVWVAASNNQVAHWDGVGWRVEAVPAPSVRPITAIWGSDPSDVWVANGEWVGRFNGASWQSTAFPMPRVIPYATTMSGSGPNDVFVASREGGIARWNGTGWTVVASGADSVWVAAPGEAWASVTLGKLFRRRP
jgi:hypothetical protein